ncbi:2-succinylbenzoate--CoA ligase [Lyngbya sp. PCC 8106]|uniref:2-succinylbenzoate--CoA ligase n=1 Tax=Lyngbya sp. (strain PCC 8106) TaxID=313612 RepID=UPI0000EA99D0|nr:2-succinylbenzoate--CoA ligase [Lyngbya sp. PCC 8106]EAW36841.1 O-succinylbenzoic acid--CoA ligase [Lyngbya sp. PCC 8106]
MVSFQVQITSSSTDVKNYINLRTDDWLIGYNRVEFDEIYQHRFQELTQFIHTQGIYPKIILAEPEPTAFLASFLAAVVTKCPVFLCNPNWVKAEWKQVFQIVHPDVIFGNFEELNPSYIQTNSVIPTPPNSIMIPTGGSSGNLRFVIHTWETLIASVQGFQQYFNLKKVNSFCTLPLYHVSGLMQFIRSFTTGGKLAILPFKAVESGEFPNINPSEFCISLVPTQLQRLLNSPKITHWLSQFKTVLLGGAPAWLDLLQQARLHQIRLAPTYGMTETASQIVTLKPEDFLAGNNSYGQVLPHAKIKVYSEKNQELAVNKLGILSIEADSLMLGYYGLYNPQFPLQTLKSDDLGYLDEQGYLTIVGRNSYKIITGGENVYPVEVEAAIRSTGLVADVAVVGLSDNHWGQVVTAVYIPTFPDVSISNLQTALQDKLSKFKQPKYWVAVESLPRNIQGKLNFKQLEELAEKFLNRSTDSR